MSMRKGLSLVLSFVLIFSGTTASVFAERMITVNASEESEMKASVNQGITAADQFLIVENGSPYAIDLVDENRQPDKLAIYTRNFGTSTKPFGADTVEYIVSNDVTVVNSTYAQNGAAGTPIPSTGYVISASGRAAAALSSLDVGQSVRVVNVDIPVLPAKYFTVNGMTVGINKLNGPRNSNDIVYYDSSYGSRTNQNEWGMEITVADHLVTKVIAYNGEMNNSAIPENGYVLSVQIGNDAYDRLNGSVKVGDSVNLVLNSLTYQASKTSFDAFNPKVREDNPAGWDDVGNVPYPGFRGTDQMIVYNRSYGEHTGTNPWGNEVAVNADGFVISNGGNNKEIPEGGYVLSGHGVKNAWLTTNAVIGAKVKLDIAKKQVLIIFTPESYLDKAMISIQHAEQSLQKSKELYLDVPYAAITQQIADAKTVYEQAKTEIGKGGDGKLFDLLQQLDRMVTDANYMNFESRKVETRGLWLRPKEKNVQQVREHLQKIKAANINAVYLETWWDGYTTWPTTLADTELNPMYNGFDVLGAYIEEGKKLGIEIHAWVENFFAGGPVVANHPDWLLISRKGDNYEEGTYGAKWYWLNPALPAARDFVSSVYKELIAKYDIASIHLDYARYPGSGDYTNDFGYDTYTRAQFKQQHGVDPIDLKPGDAKWDTWLQFRANVINTWVERVADEAHSLKPNLQITAAVWPNYVEAPKSHAQETKYWLDHNLIDEVFHMSYVPDSSLIIQDLKNTLNIARNHAFVASGIDTFQGNATSVVIDQVNEANKNGAAGTALFEFEGLFNYKYDKELKLGVYRNEAIQADYRTTLPAATVLEEMIRKIDNIYIPFQGMNDTDAVYYKQKIRSAVQSLKASPQMTYRTASKVLKAVDRIKAKLGRADAIHTEVKSRMVNDLNDSGKMLQVYLAKNRSHYLETEGADDDEGQPEHVERS